MHPARRRLAEARAQAIRDAERIEVQIRAGEESGLSPKGLEILRKSAELLRAMGGPPEPPVGGPGR